MPPGETDYYERRRKTWLNDPETRGHYERERREIEQVDAVIRSLDQLRVDAGVSKAELARRIGRNPSSIRRLFTARGARPELPLIVSIADVDATLSAAPEARVVGFVQPRREGDPRVIVRPARA